MRWLFVGVVALNLLYFGWRLTLAPEDVPSAPAAAPTEKTFPSGLKLLSEAGASAVAPGDAPRPPALKGCPAVGPWATDADAKRVAGALSDAGMAASARVIELKGATVYWVYLPAFSQRALALRKLRELQAKGIDSFVVSDGSDANAISLGSFTAKDSALGVQSRLRAAGYAAEIRTQSRDVQQNWVILKNPAAQGYVEHMPSDLRDKAHQERLDCI